MSTFSNQPLLPRLPVPSLQSTCDRYVLSALPFCESRAEEAAVEAAAVAFAGSREGARWQGALEQLAAESNNWN